MNTLDLLDDPWTHTQKDLFNLREFCEEAKKYGYNILPSALRVLYLKGALVPIYHIARRKVTQCAPSRVLTSDSYTRRILDEAHAAGRLQDPGNTPTSYNWEFSDKNPHYDKLWYSQWQLLTLPSLVQEFTYIRPPSGSIERCAVRTKASPWVTDDYIANRNIASLLATLGGCYLPHILHILRNARDEWHLYTSEFKAADVLNRVGVGPEYLMENAERLLMRAGALELTGAWWELIAREPDVAMKELTGAPRLALAHRVAAEVLLHCYEDTTGRNLRTEQQPKMGPLRGRLPGPGHTLDPLLTQLGASPFPCAVLMVEGATEKYLIPKIHAALGLVPSSDVMTVYVMGGVGNKVAKIASYAATPMIEKSLDSGWLLARPCTSVIVAVDPDSGWETQAAVARNRKKIIDELEKAVNTQILDGRVQRSDLETLVHVRTWSAQFEWAHFSDDELANSLLAIHACAGLSYYELRGKLSQLRATGHDIGKLWENKPHWRRFPSKVRLVEELWPYLEEKIKLAINNKRPMPELASAVHFAYMEGLRLHGPYRYGLARAVVTSTTTM